MANLDTLYALESSLASRLCSRWYAACADKIALAARKVVSRERIESFEFPDTLGEDFGYIRFHAMSSYLHGAVNFTGDLQSTWPASTKQAPEMVLSAQGSLGALVRDAWRTVDRAAIDVIPKMFRQEDMSVDTVSLGLADYVGKVSKSVIKAAASVHTSRYVSLGFLSEAAAAGASKYRISDTGCDLCRLMDGKEFKVSLALQRLEFLLSLSEPKDLIREAPWTKKDAETLDKVSSLSLAELASLGLDLPPYHPMCRGILLPA